MELRELFLSLDKTGTGTISLAELKAAIRDTQEGDSPKGSRGLTPLSTATGETPGPVSVGSCSPITLQRANSAVISQLFDVLDANSDEEIYYSDFLAATLDARSQLRDEAVRAAFHRLDADGSGTTSASDLRRVLGETFEGVNVDLLVKEADAEGQG